MFRFFGRVGVVPDLSRLEKTAAAARKNLLTYTDDLRILALNSRPVE